MKLTYGTNISAMRASRQLGRGQDAISTLFERLSSGQRINRASDDAAGLAIADTLRADARVYGQAIRNLNDGVSLFTIVDSALNELTNVTTRLQELAAQAANGSYSSTQRQALDQEAQALAKEYTRIVQSVEFNDMKLLNGETQSVTLQAGIGEYAQLAGDVGGAIGTGSFTSDNEVLPTTSIVSMDSGDVNGDGNVDIIALDAPGVVLHLGNGEGGFTDGGVIAPVVAHTHLADINGDGNLDLVYRDSGLVVATSLGNGDGSFGTAVTSATQFDIDSISFGDFNGDGLTDIVSTFGTSRFEVLLGDGSGAYTQASSLITVTAGEIEVADLNGDGLDDLVLSGTGLGVALNTGGGVFSTPTELNGVDGFSTSAIADLNGDGYEDVVGANLTDDVLEVYLGNAEGGFASAGTYGDSTSIQDIELGDINGDGHTDIVFVDNSDDVLGTLLGNGNGTFASQTTVSRSNTGAQLLELDDFNNDGVLDALAGFIGFSLHSGETQSGVAPLLSFSLENIADAKMALSRFTQKLEQLTTQRGEIGAFESRISHSINVLTSTRENYLAAESRIRDADIAQDAAELVRMQILQQAQTAILGQANLQPEIVISLIKNSG